MQIRILAAIVYALLIAAAVFVEHRSRLSRLPELVRRGINGCTILLPALVLALLGLIDLWTWFVITLGVVTASGILTALVLSGDNDDELDDLRRKVRKLTDYVVH